MEVKILTNYYNDDLWCLDCKKRINFGEKFGIIYGVDIEGTFETTYHLDCIPCDEDDIYLTEE
jgi:hypothetical protein